MTEVWDQYRDLLIGCWENISYEMFVVDASHRRLVAKPHGETPLGRLSISPQGWVAAHLARPDRMGPLPSGKPWMTAPDQEVAHVARGLSMYCGYMKLYRNDEGQLYWQTRVEVSTDPSRMGGIEERKVTLVDEDGKTFLFLEPKQDMLLEVSHASAAAFSGTFEITDWSQDGTKTRAVLKWEKFE
ncbi:uncharacterized protein MYCFIDRAFT_77372 [Pseudocercospora fijiensis CIRAD86]|uniref:Lipocalin-like domain-containing protein n=1 Tax=Pseudocercospora fijiensis (strain CIRAD86) TaxID=383855 RepID=M3AQD4_PSEFD|nr:uncharacterized protein MYCFIDRAFT_77372 [Pseudocercospora fijiensis CIRAD86]EME86811.1 hypothetical protein MYCFIDRAFT_77372 [Pseudocercospora fijiensis CIRAD86]